jgi:hypothetical protein
MRNSVMYGCRRCRLVANPRAVGQLLASKLPLRAALTADDDECDPLMRISVDAGPKHGVRSGLTLTAYRHFQMTLGYRCRRKRQLCVHRTRNILLIATIMAKKRLWTSVTKLGN